MAKYIKPKLEIKTIEPFVRKYKNSGKISKLIQ